jgi:NAD(P)H-hydrate epimerase
MKVVTSLEMKEIDSITINKIGIPSCVLMERAGLIVSSKILELFNFKKAIVIVGSGNNGGDGLVVARNLKNEGWDIKTFITTDPKKLKDDALMQYKIALNFGLQIDNIEKFINYHQDLTKEYPLIIDAIFGTGLSKNITGLYEKVINAINNSNAQVVSIDIPSGISSDTGQIMGIAVKANHTITFGLPKRGHLLYPGFINTGNLHIENIGFPESLLKSDNIKVDLIERNLIRSIIPKREKYSHKGTYGHVLIVGGSQGKTGACLMSSKACIKAGAGLVTIGIAESLKHVYESRVTEEMTYILPDKKGTISYNAADKILNFLNENADILAIGPGLGLNSDIVKIISEIIKNSNKPMIIDADGLNALKGNIDILLKRKNEIILTPHPGEMMRLVNLESKDSIENNRIEFAQKFSTKYKVYLVLKGVPTVISTPDGYVYINPTGNPGMATAGSGDVLTGIIAGLYAQNKSALNSCILATYIHGLAGDIAAKEYGEISLTATDIINKISDAFNLIINDA